MSSSPNHRSRGVSADREDGYHGHQGRTIDDGTNGPMVHGPGSTDAHLISYSILYGVCRLSYSVVHTHPPGPQKIPALARLTYKQVREVTTLHLLSIVIIVRMYS